MSRAHRFVLFAIAVLCAAPSWFAQAQVATGTPPFGSFGGGPVDIINLANNNVHYNIAVLSLLVTTSATTPPSGIRSACPETKHGSPYRTGAYSRRRQ